MGLFLVLLAFSGCSQEAQEEVPAGTGNVTFDEPAFTGSGLEELSKEEICKKSCSDFGYSNWSIKEELETGKQSCLCTKEVCRREETPTAIYKYCDDVEYRFYFND